MAENKSDATKSGEDKVTLPGTGEDTPNPAQAVEEHEAAVKAARESIDPEYDPLANRDPVRNADDATATQAALAEEDRRPVSVQQIAQFDESSGQSVLHSLAHPPKAALEAEKFDPTATEADPIDDALRAAVDAAAERKLATTRSDTDEKSAVDTKEAPAETTARKSTAKTTTSRTAAKK